jgi:hypothetical protein
MSERDSLLVEMLEEGRINMEEFEELFQMNGYVIENEIEWVITTT